MTDPIALTLDETPNGTRVSWTAVTGNPTFNVIQGRLHEITETESAFSLGEVVCIEAGSFDATTAGLEQAENPLPGEVFFYVVEYDDGARVSYGEESAAKPRTVSAGDCPQDSW